MHWLDPSALPVVTGHVARFTINRYGDGDGVLLDDDRQVHVPPHMGAALERGEALKRKGIVVVDVHEIAFESDMAEG